jgi:hypothetical protein
MADATFRIGKYNTGYLEDFMKDGFVKPDGA